MNKCVHCGTSLGARMGVIKDGLRFCNDNCARSYFNPWPQRGFVPPSHPEPPLQVETKMKIGLPSPRLKRAVGKLKKKYPRLSLAGLLALAYLGWDGLPELLGDYRVYQKVRHWVRGEQELAERRN